MDNDLDFVVEEAESGKALDSVLRGRTKQSWGKVRQWIQRGKVTVDGIRMLDPVKWVRLGSTVSLKQAARRYDPDALEDDRIVYLDSHVVVVRKPAVVCRTVVVNGVKVRRCT